MENDKYSIPPEINSRLHEILPKLSPFENSDLTGFWLEAQVKLFENYLQKLCLTPQEAEVFLGKIRNFIDRFESR